MNWWKKLMNEKANGANEGMTEKRMNGWMIKGKMNTEWIHRIMHEKRNKLMNGE